MQLYRGMDIGTAKLPVAERRGMPHHQLDVLDVTETATVARYQRDAAADVEAHRGRGAVPVIVGGSMIYVQSLLDDWAFPATDPAVRARWEAAARRGRRRPRCTPSWPASTPTAAASILPTDGRRIVRALEVVELTGHRSRRRRRPSARRDGTPPSSDWIGTQRFSMSVWRGAPTRCSPTASSTRWRPCSTRGLRDGVTASRALGYAQVLDGARRRRRCRRAGRARERTFIGTRRYVRRQRSWFRRDHRILWLDGAAGENVEDTLRAWRHVS